MTLQIARLLSCCRPRRKRSFCQGCGDAERAQARLDAVDSHRPATQLDMLEIDHES